MTTATADRTTAPIRLGYPSLRKAAEILGVNASTLSRRNLDVVEMGAQTRLSARTVMEEAAYFNRRDRNEVAAELKRTLEHFKVPQREKGEVLAAFAAHKNEVTAGAGTVGTKTR